MRRRMFLHYSLAAPVVLARPAFANLGGDERTRRWVANLVFTENGTEEQFDKFYVRHGQNAYRLNINHTYEPVDESNAGGVAVAANFKRGSLQVGAVYRWGDDLHATTDRVPQARNASVFFRVDYDGMKYSLRDRLRLRARSDSGLPTQGQLQRASRAGDFHLNPSENAFIVEPRQFRIGVRLRFR